MFTFRVYIANQPSTEPWYKELAPVWAALAVIAVVGAVGSHFS